MSQIVGKLIIGTKGNQRLIQKISWENLCTNVLKQSVEKNISKLKAKKKLSI